VNKLFEMTRLADYICRAPADDGSSFGVSIAVSRNVSVRANRDVGEIRPHLRPVFAASDAIGGFFAAHAR
jgi:hypothetical protein